MTPNIFSLATKELSQDAFIAWLLQWADPSHQSVNPTLNRCAQSFVNLLLGNPTDFIIRSINAGRQWENIDVWAEINDEILLIIEDKTHSGEHSSQLERYRAIAEEWANNIERGKPWVTHCVYLKTGDEASSFSKEIQSKGWRTLGRKELTTFFKQHQVVNNDIFNDFSRHLIDIEENSNAFISKQISTWNNNQWVGFYRWLEDQAGLPKNDWFWVNNPAGGFWGYLLNWEQRKNAFPLYIQLESHTGNLCFKIATHPDDTGHSEAASDRSAVRNDYHNILLRAATEASITGLRRPDRFGNGNYMTIAIVEPQHWLGFGNALINQSEVLARLVDYHNFTRACAHSWPSKN